MSKPIIPPLPGVGESIVVSLDILPEWLDLHKLEIVKFDGNFNNKVIEVRNEGENHE